MYATTFTVRGSGHFPTDMLRYDACYPMSQEDVSAMHLSIHRLVCLVKTHKRKNEGQPTVNRWKSFGWTVEKTYPPRKID